MLKNIRDVSIILWVMCQGFGWLFPDMYGTFDAQKELAYILEMERLGVWSE